MNLVVENQDCSFRSDSTAPRTGRKAEPVGDLPALRPELEKKVIEGTPWLEPLKMLPINRMYKFGLRSAGCLPLIVSGGVLLKNLHRSEILRQPVGIGVILRHLTRKLLPDREIEFHKTEETIPEMEDKGQQVLLLPARFKIRPDFRHIVIKIETVPVVVDHGFQYRPDPLLPLIDPDFPDRFPPVLRADRYVNVVGPLRRTDPGPVHSPLPRPESQIVKDDTIRLQHDGQIVQIRSKMRL